MPLEEERLQEEELLQQEGWDIDVFVWMLVPKQEEV
jgi:hypothetical protein